MMSNFFPSAKHLKGGEGGEERKNQTPQSNLQKSAIFLLRLSDVFYLSITKAHRKDSLFTGTHADLTDLMQKAHAFLCTALTYSLCVSFPNVFKYME